VILGKHKSAARRRVSGRWSETGATKTR